MAKKESEKDMEQEKEVNINIDADGGDDDEKDEMDKSESEETEEEIPIEALNKSVQELAALAKSEGTVDDRQQALAEKLQSGDLDKSEKMELLQLLAQDDEMKKSFTEIIREDELIKSEVDATDFLDAYVVQVGSALDGLADGLHKSEERQWRFNKSLAQVVVAQREVIGELNDMVKSLAETVEAIGNTPQPRKSVMRKSEALQKPFTGGAAEVDDPQGLTKSQAIDGMSKLIQKGEQHVNGEDILIALTKCQMTGELSSNMEQALAKAQG